MATCVLDYKIDGQVAVLKMIHEDNKVNLEFVNQFLDCLEIVVRDSNVKVLVTTGHGKFYSNGIDLWKVAGYSKEDLATFVTKIQLIYQTLLTFPKPTIAALNGHTYAAGGFLALAHDYRVMREDRGWFCLPEIKLEKRFSFVLDLVKAKIPPSEHMNCIVMGKRYTAIEALEAKIVHHTGKGTEQVMNKAMELSERLIKEKYSPTALKHMKMDVYEKECASLGQKSKL